MDAKLSIFYRKSKASMRYCQLIENQILNVNQRIYVKDFIGDPDKMAGGHFSGLNYDRSPFKI